MSDRSSNSQEDLRTPPSQRRRASARNTTHSGVVRAPRRPTPVAQSRRARNAGSTPPPSRRASISDHEGSMITVESTNNAERPARRSVRLVSRSRDRIRPGPSLAHRLTWYERLIPDFVLGMSAPLTGYETRVDSYVDEYEYEILERERLKRNLRIRRRLLALALIAGAATAFYVAKGRLFRPTGVKATVNTFKHRLEDGLVKGIHDTMGK